MTVPSFHSNAQSWTRMGIAALLVRCFSDTQRRHDEALKLATHCFERSQRNMRFSAIGPTSGGEGE
jgi:hypothetical protein